MKIKINKKSILRCLNTVSRAIPPTPILPITGNFLFKIADNKCYIYANNTQLQIKGLVTVDCDGDVDMCIPANTLMNTVKLLNEEELLFNYNPEKFVLNIVAGKKKYKITGFDPVHYPIQDVKEDEGTHIKTPTANVINHIKALSTTVDWTDMREQLAGITMIVNKGFLEITGANSGNYFYRGITSVKPEGYFELILPKDISLAMGNSNGKGDLDMIFTDKKISVKMDGFEFISTLMNYNGKPILMETYCSYNNEKFIVIDKDEMLGSLRRLSNYSSDSMLVMSIEGEELRLSSERIETQVDGEEILDIKNQEFEDKLIGLNIKFLLSILSNIAGDKVKFYNEAGKHRRVFIQDCDNVGYSEIFGLAEMVINESVKTV